MTYAGCRDPKVTGYKYAELNPNLPMKYIVEQLWTDEAIIGVARLALINNHTPLKDDATAIDFENASRAILAGTIITPSPEIASNYHEFLDCDLIILPRKRVYDTNKVLSRMRIDQVLTSGVMSDPVAYLRRRAGLDEDE